MVSKMNTYSVSFNGFDWQNIFAETASKARYEYYKINEFEEKYSEVFRLLRSKKIGKFKINHLFDLLSEEV